MTDAPALVTDLAQFLDSAVSPAHAVDEVTRRLIQADFKRIDERDAWPFQPGQRLFVTRGTGSVIAIEMGLAAPHEAGFIIIGAHTDSPNLRLRPRFDAYSQGHALLSVEPYGSPLLHTWLDRELGVAGTVVVAGSGPVLVRSSDSVARVSSLAVHLNRDVNRQGLKIDPQTQLRPTVALESTETTPGALWEVLLSELSLKLSRAVALEEILHLDLGLFDIESARRFGARKELLASGRLDNLASCHAALCTLLTAQAVGNATRMVVLYDHEEVGSRSSSGAQSTFLSEVVARLAQAAAPLDPEANVRSLARSLFLSADMAHAVHPNHAEKHDEQHRPRLGGGPVLKTNVNQAYASDLDAVSALTQAASSAQVVLQHFVARNDIPCGSTIGPIAAARSGLRVTDIGNPMLSMHSCREVMAVADVEPYINVMRAWFEMKTLP